MKSLFLSRAYLATVVSFFELIIFYEKKLCLVPPTQFNRSLKVKITWKRFYEITLQLVFWILKLFNHISNLFSLRILICFLLGQINEMYKLIAAIYLFIFLQKIQWIFQIITIHPLLKDVTAMSSVQKRLIIPSTLLTSLFIAFNSWTKQ